MIRSGRAVAETATAFGVSWSTARAALNEAVALLLPDVDALRPRMLGIDEHWFRSVRFFTATNKWQRIEPWMTTIVDLDTGQIQGVVDGRDHTGVGASLPQRPLQWRLGVQIGGLSRSTRRQHSHQARGRRGRAVDPASAHRMLLLRAADSLSEPARARLETVFATDDLTGKLRAAWNVKEQVRSLLCTGSLADAAAAKDQLEYLVKESDQPETTRLWRTICRWWKEIEALIVTGATTGKVEANNTSIKHIKNIKRTARGYRNSDNYKSVILMRSAAKTAA